MMPPAPTRIVFVPAGDVADHDRRRRARDARACCGARRARSAGSPSARRAARGRASCAARRQASRPRRSGRGRARRAAATAWRQECRSDGRSARVDARARLCLGQGRSRAASAGPNALEDLRACVAAARPKGERRVTLAVFALQRRRLGGRPPRRLGQAPEADRDARPDRPAQRAAGEEPLRHGTRAGRQAGRRGPPALPDSAHARRHLQQPRRPADGQPRQPLRAQRAARATPSASRTRSSRTRASSRASC